MQVSTDGSNLDRLSFSEESLLRSPVNDNYSQNYYKSSAISASVPSTPNINTSIINSKENKFKVKENIVLNNLCDKENLSEKCLNPKFMNDLVNNSGESKQEISENELQTDPPHASTVVNTVKAQKNKIRKSSSTESSTDKSPSKKSPRKVKIKTKTSKPDSSVDVITDCELDNITKLSSASLEETIVETHSKRNNRQYGLRLTNNGHRSGRAQRLTADNTSGNVTLGNSPTNSFRVENLGDPEFGTPV